MEVRGSGILGPEAVSRLYSADAALGTLATVLVDTVDLGVRIIRTVAVPEQETPEQKQEIIALVALTRLLEVTEAIVVLSAYGPRNELQCLFRVFLDAYFIVANLCSDPDFVPTYFKTDEQNRLKLMRVASKRGHEVFGEVRAYATSAIQEDLADRVSAESIQKFNSYLFAERIGCGDIYDSIYRMCSAAIHSTPRSLEDYVETDDAGNIVAIVHERDIETARRTLFDTHYFLVKALRGLCELTNYDPPELVSLDVRRERAMQQTGAETFFYFAYGSNMCTRWLAHRTPTAKPIAVGQVIGRRLRFDKVSKDGSGKCDARPGGGDDRVYGVVFQIARQEKAKLDRAEGVGKGYAEERVQVVTLSGTVSASTYVATEKDASYKPYHWYKELVLAGALEHGLPQDYIERIRSIESVEDPDAKRAESNRAFAS